MAGVLMADVIMADAPPVKRQRGDAVSVVFDHPIFSSFPLASKTWYVEERDTVEDLKAWVQWEVFHAHQVWMDRSRVFFMLVAGEDRQIVRRLDRTDPLAALLKGIHLPILQMQPCAGQDANVFPVRYVQVQHFR